MKESLYREMGCSSQALRSILNSSTMGMVESRGLSAKEHRRLVMLVRNWSENFIELALQARRGIASRSLMGKRCSAVYLFAGADLRISRVYPELVNERS